MSPGRPSQTLHVAISTDERYALGAAMTLVSAARSTDPCAPMVFHVLDGGLTASSWQYLERLVTAARPNTEVCRHAYDAHTLGGLASFNGGQGSVYARLLLPDLLNEERALYLDSDVLVLRDLASLWSLELGDALAAVVRDETIPRLGDDCPWWSDRGLDPDGPYFNSGVMFMNLTAWRRTSVSRHCLDLLAKESSRPLYADQTALNCVMVDQVLWLDPSWNRQMKPLEEKPFGEGDILHFASSEKPWIVYRPVSHYGLWYQLARREGVLDPGRAAPLRFKVRNRLLDWVSPALPTLFRARQLGFAMMCRKQMAVDCRRLAKEWRQYVQGCRRYRYANHRRIRGVMEGWGKSCARQGMASGNLRSHA